MIEGKIGEFNRWLTERELSPNTIDSYCTAMRQFFALNEEVNLENALAWKRRLMAGGLAPQTVNLRLCALNSYCEMENIPMKIRRIKIQQKFSVQNVISREDYERLLVSLEKDGNIRWYWNIKLLAMTGARVSEFVRLKKSDLDRGYAELWTKGKIRRIYIPQALQDSPYWKSFPESSTLVVSRCGKPLTTRGVSAELQRFAKQYGIDPKVMHPHAFRHLFALEFLKQTKDISLLADVLGHSSVSTTAIYTRMTQEQQAAAINKAVNW